MRVKEIDEIKHAILKAAGDSILQIERAIDLYEQTN